MAHLYILGTIVFTVLGQLLIKWRMTHLILPTGSQEKLFFLLSMFFDPGVLGGFFCAFLASLCWMAAMTKFQLSYAYPFMSLSFVSVLFLSGALFSEPITPLKLVGMATIIVGVFLSSKG